VLTRRYTTNSRGPGQWGIPVAITVVGAASCVKCRRIRKAGVGPHAPRRAKGGLVDCAGDRIQEGAR
jgi:hypothetical protein